MLQDNRPSTSRVRRDGPKVHVSRETRALLDGLASADRLTPDAVLYALLSTEAARRAGNEESPA
jgi:hypothetical protein